VESAIAWPVRTACAVTRAAASVRTRGARPGAVRAARALAFAAALVLARGAGAGGTLEVAATIHPVAMLAAAVGGSRVSVVTLVPPRASPHVFEPQPGDLARLAGARLLIEVGGGLDGWAARLRGAAGGGLERMVLLEAAGLDPLPAGEGRDRGLDPHVWLDPLRVRDALAPALAARLTRLDPAGGADYARRLAAFQAELAALDAEIRRLLDGRGRRFVAYHAAWRYFAARYGLEELGVVAEAPGEEPTPRTLAALATAARRASVRAILIEPQLPSRVAEVLAADLGLELVEVDPQGDPADPERAHYAALMRWNARAFARALGAAAP
jgi:ABC-type Zn uptake system ZnuABC Zn-binding protein ZnuA